MIEFGAWLFRTSWQASVLIVLVLAIRSILRRWLTPRSQYALWLLVLVRLALPAVPASPTSIFNLVRLWPGLESDHPVLGMAPGASLVDVSASPPPDGHPSTWPPNASRAIRVQLALLAVWAIVAASLLVRIVMGSYRLASRVGRHRLVTRPDVLDLLESCKQDLGVRVRITVVQSDQVASPALLGFLRPRLLLPEHLLESFDQHALRLLFLHELGHVKRWDIVVNWLATLLHVLHWFNPLVAISMARMRADRELATDSLVLSHAGEAENRRYGETLIRLLEFSTSTQVLPGSVGVLEDKTELKRRVAMIANHTQSSYRRSVVATVLLLTLAATTLTRSAAETRDPAPGTATPSEELRISARNETTGATYSGERVDANLFTVQLPVGTYVIKAELNARTGKPTPSPAVTGPVSLDPDQVAREITFDSVSTEFQTPRVILLDEDGLSARLEGKAKLLRQLRLGARAIDDLSAAFPAYVRLDHVNQTGNDIGLKGVATSLQAIAEAMAKLQQSALFPSVELRSTTEEKNAVRFELGVTARGSSTTHK